KTDPKGRARPTDEGSASGWDWHMFHPVPGGRWGWLAQDGTCDKLMPKLTWWGHEKRSAVKGALVWHMFHPVPATPQRPPRRPLGWLRRRRIRRHGRPHRPRVVGAATGTPPQPTPPWRR